MLLGFALGTSAHQVLSALLLFLLFLGALREDRTLRGVAAVGCAYLAHCALAIALASAWPEQAAACFPDAVDYWHKQQAWITTGQDPEYATSAWLPAHLQLLAGILLLSYFSLGLTPFVQGFYEVDLMNYYVGQLVAQSLSAPTAIGLGWHVWSLTRGACYALLVFEVASASLERLTGRTLSTPGRRRLRWGVGAACFILDCLLKYLMLEPVRGGLEANLSR